ncbi:hypothetical protein HK11_06035 [Acetobacter sp. DmW_043]|uniref:hypothetical protein n=1 Tax=Acetobacter sp. DmW_043 TaxID=1670658 RepID=UPI000A39381F|nr:hypothetical protein [Acetobacter sp. DmW_043]OUI88373.1 hypothetical protein HK11_06035 [Acetobacter sp. DmW_043]
MQFNTSKFSRLPVTRIITGTTGCALMLYCYRYYVLLPPDSPEHVMRHMAALIVGTIVLLGTIWA